MKRTTRVEYRYELDESERFEWIKGEYAHAGHAFTVESVELTIRDGNTADVLLRGPWIDPVPDVKPGDAAERGGWEFFDVKSDRFDDLPYDVRTWLFVDRAKAVQAG